MYESHFGLRQRPFRSTPDSGGYYPSTGHERAVGRLLRAVQDDEGLALLTGPPGTGKTLVGHCLLERLGDGVQSCFLGNSHFGGRVGLLQALLYDLGLPHEGRAEQELRLALTDHLLQNFAAGRRTVAVVDEAQHLGADELEELRLLGNLEAREGKAFQAVLVSQEELPEALSCPGLAAFRQRLAVRERLGPLDPGEAADYLMHHLRLAGARPEEVVADEALDLLARGTGGVPRLLNQAAHQALLLAFEAGSPAVDAEAALEALARLGLDGPAADTDVLGGLPEPGHEASAAEEEDQACRLFAAPRRPA